MPGTHHEVTPHLDEAADGFDTGFVELEGLRVGHTAGAHERSIYVQGRVGDLLLHHRHHQHRNTVRNITT